MSDPTPKPSGSFTKPVERHPDDELPPTTWRRFININMLGILLILLAGGWSVMRVSSIQRNTGSSDGYTEIRIAHWQLEAGFRDALDVVIKDYIALHPDKKIRIVQLPVTEKVYAQWLNVNLIAGTPPDIAEMGRGLSQRGDSVAKYYIPLGREIGKPNPYNAPQYLDTMEVRDPALMERLATAPWRETLVDGMRGGWQDSLQDYYAIPTSFFTVRMFYNKTLFREALGSDAPPRTLAELLDACERLSVWAKDKPYRFFPIAGTGYHRYMFVNNYRIPFTHGYQDVADVDLSCDISNIESWIAFQTGKAKVGDPPYRAYMEVVRRICEQFNPNFAAMDRDQAISAFAQGRSALMASGSWDAASVFLASDFEVGICTFPMPAPGEPYGEYGRFPINEASTNGGCAFGIPKTCPNKELALDFLRFLTSQKWGGKFNELNGFLPITIGTLPSEQMREFMPNPYGVLAHLNFGDGYDLATKIEGVLDKYLGGELDFAGYEQAVTQLFADGQADFDRIWYKTWEKTVDNTRSLERTIAVLAARELLGIGATGDEAQRQRETILDQALLNQGANVRHLHATHIGGSFPKAP